MRSCVLRGLGWWWWWWYLWPIFCHLQHLPPSLTSQNQTEAIPEAIPCDCGGGGHSLAAPALCSSPAPRAHIVATFPMKCLVISEAISGECAAAALYPAFPVPGAEGSVASWAGGWRVWEGPGSLSSLCPPLNQMDGRRDSPSLLSISSFLSSVSACLLLWGPGVCFPLRKPIGAQFPRCVRGSTWPWCWENLEFCSPEPTHSASPAFSV